MFDVNTAIGHWPFRKLLRNSAAELYGHLRSFGIKKAAVWHNHAVFYMNAQAGNLELAKETERYNDFFMKVATLNPAYAAACKDLQYCVRQLGFSALRLLPKYHGYSLQDSCLNELLCTAQSLNIPVFLPFEIVNFRQKHWMEPDQPLESQSIIELCRRYPGVNFILCEGGYVEEMAGLANLYVEMSRYRSSYGQVLAKMIKKLGAERILFGSGSPFKEIEPALLKLRFCEVSEEQKELISFKNADRLLRPGGA
ncbi:MAG: amidohydrolase family protein [Lentisphaerae bacterium]|nr:amidohydrolase family protein [Lentisphaerota bacterium]